MIEKWNLEKANKRSIRTTYQYEDKQVKKQDETKETKPSSQDWIGERDILASESNELNENKARNSPHAAVVVSSSSNKMVKSLILPRPLIYTNSNSSSASSSTSSSNTSSERKSSTSSSSQSSSASYSDYSHFSINNFLSPVVKRTETITILQTYIPNLNHNQSITPNKNNLTEANIAMSSNYGVTQPQPCHSLGTTMSTSSSNLSTSTSPALSNHVGYLDKADHSIRVRKHLQNTLHRRHNSSCNLPAEPNSLGPNIKIENGRSLSPSSAHTCCHHHHKPISNSNKRVNNQEQPVSRNENTQNRQFLTIPSNTFNHSPILEWSTSTSQDESNDGSSLDLCNPQQCRNATRSLCQSRSASIAHSPSTMLTTAALFRSFAAQARTTNNSAPTNSLDVSARSCLTKTRVPISYFIFNIIKNLNLNL